MNSIDSCSFNQLENVHLLPTSKKIYGYRSTEPLPVVGKMEAEVKLSGLRLGLLVWIIESPDSRKYE